MKIQTRLYYLLISVMLLISFIVTTFWLIDRNRTTQLIASKKQEKQLLLDRSISLTQKTVEIFVYDYSYWDEMLEFTKHPDSSWAYVNIETVLASYNAQTAWVFNGQNKMMYSVQIAHDSALLKFPAPDSSWRVFQSNNYFTHYFVWTDTVLLEVFGAPIQPSNDIKRVTTPQGSFFAGRLWNKKFINQLEEINNTTIRIDQGGPDTIKHEEEIIHSHEYLTGWDNSVVAVLHSEFRSSVISENSRLSQYQIGLLLLFGMILIVLLVLFIRGWIISPLRELTNALLYDKPEALHPSKHRTFEFQQISQLITTFFRQKEDLLKEIETRAKAEQALIQSEKDYRNLFEFAHDAILVIDPDQLTIVMVNEACNKLYQYNNNDLQGSPLSRIWPDPKSIQRLISEIDVFNAASRFEARHINREQTETLVEINACMIRYQSQNAILCINRDITEKKVIESLQLSHTILMSVRNLVLVSNAQGHIIYANHAVKDMLGFELADVLGDGWWNLTREGTDGTIEKKSIQQAAADRRQIQTVPYERWINDHWGNRRCIIWSDSTAPGNLLIGVGYDITDRIRAQRALEASEQRYRFLFDHIPIPMLIFQAGTFAIIAVNEPALELFGFIRADLPDTPMKEWLEQPPENGTDDEGIAGNPEIRLFRKADGSLVEIELQYHDFQLTDEWFRLAILFDRSLKEKNEKADVRLRLQKVHLSGVIEALEDERKRMANELHDGLGQILSGSKRILESLFSEDHHTGDYQDRLAVVTQMLDNALMETKSIAFNLLPRTLEDYGLFTAIETLIQQIFGHTPIRVNYQTHEISTRMPYYIELALYRIVQEALNNISKHANATEVSVQFVGYTSVIILTIEDNGTGFDTDSQSPGMGLRSIKDRVAYLDGNLHIDSTQGQGTSLIIEIPKREES